MTTALFMLSSLILFNGVTMINALCSAATDCNSCAIQGCSWCVYSGTVTDFFPFVSVFAYFDDKVPEELSGD